jgi:F-type H+-transporting ATPase subunit gamma
MSQILQIKKRLKGIQNIYKVTKAMETMAITGLRRVQKQFRLSEDYAQGIKMILDSLNVNTPLNKKEPDKVYVLLFSQRGFCGNFNNNLLNYFNSSYPYLKRSTDKVYTVGPLANRFTKRLIKTNIEIISYEDLAKTVLSEIKAEKDIQLVYNKYFSILKQTPQLSKLYPFSTENDGDSNTTYFEPDKKTLEDNIIPLYLESLLNAKKTESLLGEYCNRFHSMKSANDNAKILIDELKIELNKTRQSTITAELSEVVSAFEVMHSR